MNPPTVPPVETLLAARRAIEAAGFTLHPMTTHAEGVSVTATRGDFVLKSIDSEGNCARAFAELLGAVAREAGSPASGCEKLSHGPGRSHTDI
ncbi:MAG: hypothetical protein AAFY08_11920 [Planctomycetota bacterium]